MAEVLLTGATGTLGRVLRPRLLDAGLSVRAASRSPPEDGSGGEEWVELDLATGSGIDRAVEGVDAVVHTATDPTGDPEAVDVRGTERLLDAAESADVGHVVYVSIVGVDEVPYSYYRHKLAAEEAVEASDVPETILRATQFHRFVGELLDTVARSPVWPLPTDFRVQPVDTREVADALVECAGSEPQGRVPPIGGPEVRTGRELATAYREARDLRRLVLRLPIPGATATEFRAGTNTCPDRAVGTTTWESWLTEQYGHSNESAATPPTESPS